jgi:hypothetical protein
MYILGNLSVDLADNVLINKRANNLIKNYDTCLCIERRLY